MEFVLIEPDLQTRADVINGYTYDSDGLYVYLFLQINNVYGVGPLVLTLMAKIHGIIL